VYNSNQPRVPKGSPDGGQWIGGHTSRSAFDEMSANDKMRFIKSGGEVLEDSTDPRLELSKMVNALPVVINPNLGNEATTISGVRVEIGPKFQAYPKQIQLEILTHEAAHFHELDMWYLKNKADWDLAARTKAGHLNGQTTPGEIIVEAYSVAWHDPGFLRANAPGLLRDLRDGIIAVGLPMPPLLRST